MYQRGSTFPPFVRLDFDLLKIIIQANYALGKLNELNSSISYDVSKDNPLFILEATTSVQMDLPDSPYDNGKRVSFREALMSYFLNVSEIKPNTSRTDIFTQIRAFTEAQVFNFINSSKLDQSNRGLFDTENTQIGLSFESLRVLHSFMTNRYAHVGTTMEELTDIKEYTVKGDVISGSGYFKAPKSTDEFIKEFEWLAEDPFIPLLIKLPILCFYLMVAQPFKSNNDPFVRLFIPTFMVNTGILKNYSINMSFYFLRTQEELYETIHSCLHKGELSDWIKYFIKGITNQSYEGLDKSIRIHNLCEEYKELFGEENKANIIEIIKWLEHNPYIPEDYITRRLHLTQSQTNFYISELLAKGVLQEVTKKRYKTRFFCCEGLLDILEESRAIESIPLFNDIMTEILKPSPEGKISSLLNVDSLLNNNIDDDLRHLLEEIKLYTPEKKIQESPLNIPTSTK